MEHGAQELLPADEDYRRGRPSVSRRFGNLLTH